LRGGEGDDDKESREEIIWDLQMQSFLLKTFIGSFPRREGAICE
jgi:hypothetical protein